MFRKYVIITLAAFFVIGHTGCTSKRAQDESADVEASADDESLESAEAIENNDDLEIADGGEATAELGGDDLAPEEQLPDDGGMAVAETEVSPSDISETPPMDEAPPADTAIAETDPSEAPMDDGMAAPDESYAQTDTATPEPGMDMAATDNPPLDSSFAPTPEPSFDEAPKPVASLKKIHAQPYRHGNILVNAVYLARPGDTVEKISQKVFASSDRVKELCRVNEYNCSRPIKVGDKFYYNSPQRPNDDTVVKTFYEDAGITPQMYTTNQGDNIRKLGKELLGHERSWMELWATNDVESKGDLDEGITLRYWPSTETAAPVQTLAENEPAAPPAMDMAMNEPPPPPSDMGGMPEPPPMEEPLPPGDMAMNEPPPPPPMDMGQGDLPPPPDMGMQGSVEPPPPPPPPPPADNVGNQMANNDVMMGEDPNQTMMLGVGVVLILAALALFISIRKKRARRQIDFNTATQTQIE